MAAISFCLQRRALHFIRETYLPLPRTAEAVMVIRLIAIQIWLGKTSATAMFPESAPNLFTVLSWRDSHLPLMRTQQTM